MATVLSDNTAYLEIELTDYSSQAISFKLTHEGESLETTCGFGTEYRSMAGGLKQTTLEVVRCYEVGEVLAEADVAEIYNIVLGIEGQGVGTGKPVQDFILETVDPIERKVEGGPVFVTFSYVGAAPPTTNVFDGGVW